MPIFNDQPRPRALFEDLGDLATERLRGLFPSVREASAADKLYEAEIDVLVTAAVSIDRSDGMHVVAFGSSKLGIAQPRHGNQSLRYMNFNVRTSMATELRVPDDVTGELGALVRSDLIPLFTSMPEKPVVTFHSDRSPRQPAGDAWCRPFVEAGDGSVLAGAFQRRGGTRCWILPRKVADPAAWVALALVQFREVDPERVPALPGWWERPEWATPEQELARCAAHDLQVERELLLADLDSRILAAREQIRLADDAAATGMSRLLTADGEDLARAVQTGLERFGFEVEDMDDRFLIGDRREDLRVRDPDHPGWEAIVEVKGYGRGAAVNDLSRLTRWTVRYLQDEGRLPDARWHVVNAFRGLDPAARPVPLPNDDDLRDFVEDAGVLIDTRDLFTAWRAVENGAIEPEQVRKALRSTHGRWTFYERPDHGEGE